MAQHRGRGGEHQATALVSKTESNRAPPSTTACKAKWIESSNCKLGVSCVRDMEDVRKVDSDAGNIQRQASTNKVA